MGNCVTRTCAVLVLSPFLLRLTTPILLPSVPDTISSRKNTTVVKDLCKTASKVTQAEKALIKVAEVKTVPQAPWLELLQFMLTRRKSCTLHNSSLLLPSQQAQYPPHSSLGEWGFFLVNFVFLRSVVRSIAWDPVTTLNDSVP